jgi:hypothetical protein
MYPHRIRLRGPWVCEPLARVAGAANVPLPSPFRTTLPCRWRDAGLSGFAGRVRFRRHFGYPGRIDVYERVWLTFAGATGSVEIQLNEHALPSLPSSPSFPNSVWERGAAEFDVTSLLRTRNELVVDVESPNDAGGLWGEVALEVRCTAYLRDLRLRMTRDPHLLHIMGQVVGVCEGQLELYAVVDRFTVAYAKVEAALEGQAFHLVSEELGLDKVDEEHWVRIDLVKGASVWYTFEALLPRSDEGA